jgi:hypothetical protein
VILLASLRDAQATGTRWCFFVSDDKDHSPEAIKRLGKQHDVACLPLSSIEGLTEFLEGVIQEGIAQDTQAFVQLATDYLSGHTEVIQAALGRIEPIRVGDLTGRGPGILQQIARVTVAPGSVRALPQEGIPLAPMDNASLAFWFDAIVVTVIRLIASEPLPITAEPVRAGLDLSGVDFGPLGLGSFRFTDAEKEITVPIQGRAVARFDGIRYVGTPTIESLEVHRPTTLSEGLGGSRNPFAT